MRILLKYILTNVKEHKLRTAVMLLSVLLSAALLFVSASVGTSYENAQIKMARGMAGSAAVSVSASAAGAGVEAFPGIRPEQIPDLSCIRAKVGVLKARAMYSEGGYYEQVDLLAAELSELKRINEPRLSDGSALTALSDGQIVLPDRFASKYGIQKGDPVTLQIGGEGKPVTFEAAETAAYDTVFLRHTRGATALLPRETLARLCGAGDGFSEILIAPAEGVSASELKASLSAALPESFTVSQIVNEAQIAADARQKSMPFFLISFFAMTMSVFIIYSSYKVITLDRLPTIGTFRSIGAEGRTVTRLLLVESLLYGVVGGLLSLPVGTVVLKLFLRGMGKTLRQGIEIPAVISPLSVLLALGTAIAVSLLSAWLPVRRAGRLPVKEVVLGAVEERRPSGKRTAAFGAALLILSLLLPRAVPESLLYPAGGCSLLAVIAAAILVIPSLTNLAGAALERIFGAVFGNEGWLAARNLHENKNAVQNITLLFISISAVIAISVVGNFVTAYIGDVFRGAELDGFADGRMDQSFVDSVNELEGMEKVLPLYVLTGAVQADGQTLGRLEATDDLEWYRSLLNIRYTQNGTEQLARESFSKERTVLLSEERAKTLGVSIGDTVLLSGGQEKVRPTGEAGLSGETRPSDAAAAGRETAESGGEAGSSQDSRSYLVAGSFQSRATDVEAVIHARWAEEDFGAESYGFLAYTAEQPEAAMIQIRSLFGAVPNWSRTVEEFNADALTTVGTFLRPMRSMTWFILLLAAVGVVNNQLISCMQRRRAAAVYRSVGLSRRQDVMVTLLEGLSAGLVGAAAAIAAAWLEIQTIFLVAGPKITMAPELKPGDFLTAAVMGILVTLAGAAAPLLRNRRMNPAEEIKME